MKALSEYRPSMQRSYSFIDGFIKEHGFGPTVREIIAAGGLSSTSVASYHRDELIKGGFITYDPGRDRSIALVGVITLTFYGLDADFIREQFGDSPGRELAVINWLRQPVGDVPGFKS